MKYKRIRLFLLFIIIEIGMYISVPTIFIDKATYRKLGWKASGYSDTIINWKKAEVKLVNLNSNPEVKGLFLPYGTKWGEINKRLLFLNGSNAIYVRFNTTQDGLVGSMGYYFNPFTKQIIGIDVRM